MDRMIEDMLLCVAGHGGRWVRFQEMREWELFGRKGGRMVPTVARRMAETGLAELKRASAGMGVRLTAKGRAAATAWRRELDEAWKSLGVELLPVEIPEGNDLLSDVESIQCER